ncbi:hypothetical protein Tco_0467995 [Tanacetum coccineum]
MIRRRSWQAVRAVMSAFNALEARVTVLETEVHRHEWQRQAADDLAVQHIMRTQALEAGARSHYDCIKSNGIVFLMIEEKGPKRTTRSTPVTPTPNATPTTTVTEAQLQALIDQGVAAAMAKAEASRVREWLTIAMVRERPTPNLLANALTLILEMQTLWTSNRH